MARMWHYSVSTNNPESRHLEPPKKREADTRARKKYSPSEAKIQISHQADEQLSMACNVADEG